MCEYDQFFVVLHCIFLYSGCNAVNRIVLMLYRDVVLLASC